jgi:hypothetical protein
MRIRGAAAATSFVLLMAVLAGCRPVDTWGAPDRSESVAVSGGRCDISWWISPAADDVREHALKVAGDKLARAKVSDAAWEEWEALLDNDPDLDSLSEQRISGSAYAEVVRSQVRESLDDAGYPDENRLVEVYTDLDCSAG